MIFFFFFFAALLISGEIPPEFPVLEDNLQGLVTCPTFEVGSRKTHLTRSCQVQVWRFPTWLKKTSQVLNVESKKVDHVVDVFFK